LLLCAFDAAVELRRLLAELRHLKVQSPERPQKPETKHEDKA
jgi:hypothetical protein